MVLELPKWFCIVAVFFSFSIVCHAEIGTNNVEKLLGRGEFKLAAEALSDEIDMDMNKVDVLGAIDCLEKFVPKLHGDDNSLGVKTFFPPTKDDAYRRVTSEDLKFGGKEIPRWVLKAGTWVSTPFVAWGNDAQRVLVASEYIDKTTLWSSENIQAELSRFDSAKKIIDALYGVVTTHCKREGEDQGQYLEMKNRLVAYKKLIKEKRTHFLSYEVVSPYLYEAHCYLFAGISDSIRASSFNRMYSAEVEEYKREGIKLLAKACHKDWLYSCAQDVRDQFLEVQKFMKENVGDEEMEEFKVVMTLSDCNDPSKPRGADAWWK